MPTPRPEMSVTVVAVETPGAVESSSASRSPRPFASSTVMSPRSMATLYGMSDAIGRVSYERDDRGQGFLGGNDGVSIKRLLRGLEVSPGFLKLGFRRLLRH
jgi:hypothetical protein